MNRQDEAFRGPSERLYWLCNAVCLERREEPREEELAFRMLAELACKAGSVLSRVLGRRTGLR